MISEKMNSEKIAQRSATKLRFEDDDLDFYLMMALANSSAGGAEYGECFYVASQINEKDIQSWVREWRNMAARLHTLADAALQRGQRVSARGLYLRAYTYYRTATVLIRVLDPEFRATWQKAHTCFQQAAKLFEPAIEFTLVPYKDMKLPGYFIPAADDGQPRPTLIFTIGGEAFAEEGYFWVGAAGTQRGYNVLSVELPMHMGARLLNPDIRYQTVSEVVDESLSAIVDYALQRPDVDPQRLSIIGFSAGGAMAGRAAMFDSRLKACIADSPIRDMYQLFKAEFPPILQKAPAIVGDFFAKVATRQNTIAAIVLERSCWQVGANSVSEFLEGIRPLIIDPAQVKCPMLVLCSEGEGKGFVEQAKEVYAALTVPKKMHLFTVEEGADAHCQVNNFALMNQIVYDWLDDVLGVGNQP